MNLELRRTPHLNKNTHECKGFVSLSIYWVQLHYRNMIQFRKTVVNKLEYPFVYVNILYPTGLHSHTYDGECKLKVGT
jgi:hypothetical protein